MREGVIVVGGGPAGLAAAIAVRLRGWRVEVVDRAVPPIDKACGEAILPGGIAALRALGVDLPPSAGVPFHEVHFFDGARYAAVRFSGGTAIAVRRTRLHELLVERAVQVGVRLRWGCAAREFAATGAWIVGADGQNSQVRRAAGIDAACSESTRYGFRRHYLAAPWSEAVEVYWGARCQVFVTPLGSDTVGVALLSRDPHLRLDEAVTEFPRLEARLRDAEPAGAERGGVTVSRRLRRVQRGRTLLAGDASGSVDAITGKGVSLAMQQALALAAAIDADDPASYEQAHRRLMRRVRIAEKGLLLLERFPGLRKGLMAVGSMAFPPGRGPDWGRGREESVV